MRVMFLVQAFSEEILVHICYPGRKSEVVSDKCLQDSNCPLLSKASTNSINDHNSEMLDRHALLGEEQTFSGLLGIIVRLRKAMTMELHSWVATLGDLQPLKHSLKESKAVFSSSVSWVSGLFFALTVLSFSFQT